MKNLNLNKQTQTLKVSIALFLIVLCLSLFSSFLHHHHLTFDHKIPAIVFPEESCPICWFILQITAIAILILHLSLVLFIHSGYAPIKYFLPIKHYPLFLSRAPPVTV